MELTDDVRFKKNTGLDAIKQELNESMDVIRERAFPVAEFNTDLGVPYDECVNYLYRKF